MMLSAQPAPAMQSPEELAALFSRNLVLNQQPQQQQLPQRTGFEQNHFAAPEPQPTAPIIYSISQHYHHSTHVPHQQPEQPAPQRRASEPPQSEQASCEGMLRAHGLDPCALGASQTQLFRIAGPDQKARLVELWKICPPANRDENPSVAWSTTTMEQEEQLARMRYDQQQRQQQGCASMDCGSLQSADGRWDVEPYMQSGYEELMRREAEGARRLADGPKDAHSHFGAAAGGEAASSFSRATEPVYGVENRYLPQAGEGMVSWQGISRVHAPAGTADAMDIL